MIKNPFQELQKYTVLELFEKINDKIPKYTFKDHMMGRFNKQYLLKFWLPLFLTIFIVFLYVAYYFYPTDLNYSWKTNTLSSLGDFIDNPKGYWAFNIAILSSGIIMFSMAHYLKKRLYYMGAKVSTMATRLLIIGSVGMMSLSIIPETDWVIFGLFEIKYLHNTIAALMFISMLCGVWVHLYNFFWDRFSKYGKKQFDFKIGIPYGVLALSMFLGLFIRWPQIEWIITFSLLLFFYLFAILVPERLEKYELDFIGKDELELDFGKDETNEKD